MSASATDCLGLMTRKIQSKERKINKNNKFEGHL